MKKKYVNLLTLTLAVGLAFSFTGCSSNNDGIINNQTGIVFNGGGVVSLGDELFYANGFVQGVAGFDNESTSEYNNAKKHSYLAQTNLKNYNGTKFENASETKNLASHIAGFENAYMFAYGDYVYYATPSLHKTKENKQLFDHIVVSRVSLKNGKVEEVFEAKDSTEKYQIKAVNYNSKGYLLIFDGKNVESIQLGNNCNTKTISTSATSVAFPDENQEFDGQIYFTENREDENGNIAFKANVETGTKTKVCQENGKTIKFISKVDEFVFFTENESQTKILNTKTQQGSFNSSATEFYPFAISDVKRIASNSTREFGFVFTSNQSGVSQIMYLNQFENNLNGMESEILVSSEDAFSSFIAIFEGDYYYSTENGIYRKSVLEGEMEEGVFGKDVILEDQTIQKNFFGYDFNVVNDKNSQVANIYFYSQRIYEELSDENAEEETVEQNDTNQYLYSVSVNDPESIKLIGKTIK